MAHLLEITDEIRALDNLLAEADGDITGQEQIINEWAAKNKEDLADKADDYLALITEKMRMYAARKGEAERLTRLALTDKNLADRLKSRLLWALEDMGIKKLETNRYRITVATNGGKQPIDIYFPEDHLPEEYQKTVLVADKEAIREALEAGKEVNGAVFMDRGTNLRIR